MSCNFDCKNCNKKNIYTVAQLKINEPALIIRVKGEGILRQRLLEMGLTPGTKIEVIKSAPMDDPLELRLRGYVLCIRKEEAEKIEVCRY